MVKPKKSWKKTWANILIILRKGKKIRTKKVKQKENQPHDRKKCKMRLAKIKL